MKAQLARSPNRQSLLTFGLIGIISGITAEIPIFAQQVLTEADRRAIAIPLLSPSPTPSTPPEETGSGPQPLPPETGTPEGRSRPGASRFPSGCPQPEPPLTALFPIDQALTHSAYPKILVFVPYSPAEIRNMEFLILDDRERNTIFRAQITPVSTPGIIEIQAPQKEQYALNHDQTYHWYFMLSCEAETSQGPHLVLDGWFRRTPHVTDPLEATPYEALLKNDLWYDAISSLASLQAADPTYQDQWNNLLASIGYEDISRFTLVNSLVKPLN